jgi:hypothetical protein
VKAADASAGRPMSNIVAVRNAQTAPFPLARLDRGRDGRERLRRVVTSPWMLFSGMGIEGVRIVRLGTGPGPVGLCMLPHSVREACEDGAAGWRLIASQDPEATPLAPGPTARRKDAGAGWIDSNSCEGTGVALLGFEVSSASPSEVSSTATVSETLRPTAARDRDGSIRALEES